MAEAPRVLMVLEATFPKLGGGGAESQVLTIGRSLVARGFGVRVLVPLVPDGPPAGREELDGIEIVRIAYPRVRVVGGLVMLAKLAAHLVAHRREYAVIHAHIAHNMAAVASLAGRLVGRRVLVKLTGMHEMKGGILDPQAGAGSRLRRAAMRRATLVQATSSRLAGLLAACGFREDRILVLPNGVDTERFAGATRDESLRRRLAGDAALVGVFVGRLAPEKGLELLLECWSRAFRGRNYAKLVLVGDGPLRAELERMAGALGVGGQVAFAGHTADVAEHLAIADFAILASLAEGLSNALLEYMAAGLPVIGSRVSGTEDFVETGRNGWLFEPGSGEALEAALAEAGRAGPQALAAMGRAARDRIVAKASREAVIRALLEAYRLPDPAARGGA